MELQYNKRSIKQVRTSKTIKLLIDWLLKNYKYHPKQLKLGTLGYYYHRFWRSLLLLLSIRANVNRN